MARAVASGRVCGIEHGFEAPDFASSPSRTFWATAWCAAQARTRAQNFLSEASALAPGDLVTHIEHGVGRYLGLKTIEVAGRAA